MPDQMIQLAKRLADRAEALNSQDGKDTMKQLLDLSVATALITISEEILKL